MNLRPFNDLLRIALFVTLAISGGIALSEEKPGAAVAKAEKWNGFEKSTFSVGAANCIVVSPNEPAPGKPWIWRARFWGHQPQADVALLRKGFHVAYCEVGGLFGAPKALERWDAFYQHATNELGLSNRVSLEGMSRGGLIIFNWAAANPTKVNCIYGDAPVCDFKSWPGGKGKGKGDANSWRSCIKAYGFESEQQAIDAKASPIDYAQAIADAKIPVLIVYGEADPVVPPAENCIPFAEAITSKGGSVKLIGKPGVGHHPHSLKDPSRIVDFVLTNTKDSQ